MKSVQTLYDDLIKRRRNDTFDAIHDLHKRMSTDECRFGSSPVPTFLKPGFLAHREETELRAVVKKLMGMLEKVVDAYFKHPELQPLFSIPKKIRRYIEIDPGYDESIVIARPDALLENGVYRFIEFNCDSPAGAGYTDLQEDVLKKTWPMQELSRHFRWKRKKRLETLLKALMKCYRSYGGRKSHPHIAIVDWRSVKTQGEFLIIKRFFESQGYPTVIADPRELKLQNGRLRLREFDVDLVYRRVIVEELLDKKEEVRDLLRAYAHQKVCMVNPLRCRLAANKAILSIMTNPAYNYLFSEEEILTRDKHIPWTRLVVDGKKFYGGKSIYLAQMIDENRNDLVLKPSTGYGGRDVTIGKETSNVKWRRTIKRALRGGERWVVQEYVEIPEMVVPVLKGKSFVLQRKKFNVNPYVFGGVYSGALARLSDASVINVSRGGGLVPMIAYEKKA